MNNYSLTNMKNASGLTWGFFLGYALLLLFFNVVDVYHQHFFATGLIVVIYNIARLFFIVSLMWLFYFVGDCLLAKVSGEAYRRLQTLESSLLAFFAGVGVWHIALLSLGFAGLYHRSLLMIITMLLFFASLPRLDTCVRLSLSSRSTFYWPGWLLLLLPVSAFLITKGLYPAGGHDYYNHYFPFYRSVTESGNIWPNEVWYQFYYSKGVGLFFLSMLLTDPLAPQLASTAMIFAAAAIVFSTLRTSTSWRLFPWIGAALYIAFLIYTPGRPENMRQGGWGDLEKLHEPAAVLMLAVIWLTMRFNQSDNSPGLGVTLILTVSALVIISPVMAVFVGAYLAMLAFYFIFCKQKTAAKWTCLGMLVAGAWLLLIWIANYLLTGLPDDQATLIFWPFIGFKKINEWGVSFELAMLHWAKVGLENHPVPLTRVMPEALKYLRLDVWGDLLLVAIIVSAAGFCWRKWQGKKLEGQHKVMLATFGSFLSLILVFSILLGRAQPISFYRFTTFTYAPMLCFCLLLLSTVLRNRLIGAIFIVSLAVVGVWVASPQRHFSKWANDVIHYSTGSYAATNIGAALKNGARFVTGQYSLAEAYQNQQGWPGRMPWGGIYPPMHEIWKLLPAKTRVWSMHVHSYCMLPDCHMEGYMSFRFSPHMDEVLYGDPQKAKEWLKKEKLNYFFISNSLQFTDPLPLSPLFSPNNIANYFGVAWTDGNNTLLTWKEQAILPINPIWLKGYQKQVDKSVVVQSFPYQKVHVALDKMITSG